jgi:4-diphosphocytidyl-2-C-methyl-D-erythritol kinase
MSDAPSDIRGMGFNAPAKINLHLRVGRRRDDGFHPLLTWMATIGFCDGLLINLPPPGQKWIADRFTCDDPSLPTDGGNLVVRAMNAMRALVPHAPFASVELHKLVPQGGGLGGGSSDAAFTMLGLNQLWQANLPLPVLAAAAATLGSDVPFFLYGPSSICRGRGDEVRAVPPPPDRWVLLLLPSNISMPTADVYRTFDQMNLGFDDALLAEPDWHAWSQLPSADLMQNLINDLEAPAFALRPELERVRITAEQTIGRTVRMSGSGSSLFSLFDSKEETFAAVKQWRGRRARSMLGVHAEVRLPRLAWTPQLPGYPAAPWLK